MLTLIALLLALFLLPSPWGVVVVACAAVIDVIETGVFVWWSRRRRRLSPPSVGVGTLVGREGVAIGRLEPGRDGQVRVAGEIWLARPSEQVEPGRAVTVVSVDGLTLGVEPLADRDG